MRRPGPLAPLALAGVIASAALGTAPASAIYCAPWDTVCQQLKGQQNQSDSTQQRIDQIRGRISDVQSRMQALTELISVLDAKMVAEQTAIDKTQQQIAGLDSQISATEQDLRRREAQIQQREQLLGQRVRSIDNHGQLNYLALVLTAASFNQLVDTITTMQAIYSADQKLVVELRREREQVQLEKNGLDAKRAQQAALLQTEQDQRAQLAADVQDQKSALAYQQELAAQLDAQRRELEKEQAAIKARIKQLQAQYAAEGRAAGGGNGQFIWPEGGNPILTQRFGCTDLLGEPWWPSCATRHFHTGLDIAGPFGTGVVAADSGVASVFWGWGGGYGNFVIIIHGNGYASVYGHLNDIVLHDGQVVYRGQPIGHEGSTGYSTGPHLHFEIRYNDNYQDPCAYLGC